MSKKSSQYVCQNCGFASLRWIGQCQGCSSWNTMVEEVVADTPVSKKTSKITFKEDFALPFSRVELASDSKKRLSTKIDELDRVLGGSDGNKGIVQGAVMLIGGEPGIGKSTLLTQMVVEILLDEKNKNIKNEHILYVCGEENPAQIAMRIERLSRGKVLNDRLIFITSTDVDMCVAAIEKYKPALAIVDSIQTLTSAELTGAAGSVGQVRAVSERLTNVAKRQSVPIFLVGHVTKEGTISGPKVLEHIVDTVLEFSGDRTGELRLLRAIKNRFGATDEVGVFCVREFGFESISNPSQMFLNDNNVGVSGSSTCCVIEGTRPLLVEIQGLVVDTQLAMPRRVGRGINVPRIQVLSAVLQKHCYLPLGTTDIFVNVAGGFEVREPAVDLALAVSIASSLYEKPIKEKIAFIGEIGLLGEIRSVNLLDRRIKEAKRMGYTKVFSSKTHKTIKDVLKDLGLSKSYK